MTEFKSDSIDYIHELLLLIQSLWLVTSCSCPAFLMGLCASVSWCCKGMTAYNDPFIGKVQKANIQINHRWIINYFIPIGQQSISFVGWTILANASLVGGILKLKNSWHFCNKLLNCILNWWTDPTSTAPLWVQFSQLKALLAAPAPSDKQYHIGRLSSP